MITRIVQEVCSSGTRLAVAIVLNFVLCGALFAFFEGPGYFESLYWAVTTGTTTGYGDISPATLGGRLTAVWLMVTSIAFVAIFTAILTARLVQDPHLFSHAEQEELKDDVDDVHEMLYLICERLGIEVPPSVEEYHQRRGRA